MWRAEEEDEESSSSSSSSSSRGGVKQWKQWKQWEALVIQDRCVRRCQGDGGVEGVRKGVRGGQDRASRAGGESREKKRISPLDSMMLLHCGAAAPLSLRRIGERRIGGLSRGGRRGGRRGRAASGAKEGGARRPAPPSPPSAGFIDMAMAKVCEDGARLHQWVRDGGEEAAPGMDDNVTLPSVLQSCLSRRVQTCIGWVDWVLQGEGKGAGTATGGCILPRAPTFSRSRIVAGAVAARRRSEAIVEEGERRGGGARGRRRNRHGACRILSCVTTIASRSGKQHFARFVRSSARWV